MFIHMKKSLLSRVLAGFTLVELMIVITIIWILATALTPYARVYISRSNDTARITDHETIVMGLSAYYNDKEQYPLADNGCMTPNVLIGNYIAHLPKSPSWVTADEWCGANGWYGYGSYFLHYLLMANMEGQYTWNYTGSTEGFTGILSDHAIARVSSWIIKWAGDIQVSYNTAWVDASWSLIPPVWTGWEYAVNGMCSISPGVCVLGDPALDNGQTACGTTRTWDCVGRYGGSVTPCAHANAACPTYTASWTFGAQWVGATVRVCGVDVTADASGNFSRSWIPSWTACNDIAATRSGYTCTTTANGPASISTNLTWLGGSCVGIFASCTAAWQTYTATTTYPGCDTSDKIICTGNNAGYIWPMCNVGSTVAGTGTSSYGSFFQWGRNVAFPSSGNVTTSGWPLTLAAANATTNFITVPMVAPRNWLNILDDNLWWWSGTTETMGTYQSVSLANQSLMQWPCATGYHVPTMKEWCDTAIAINPGITCTATNQNDTLLANVLKTPFAGTRVDLWGAINWAWMYAELWSSTPYSTNWRYFFINSTLVMPLSWFTRASAYSLRCMRN